MPRATLIALLLLALALPSLARAQGRDALLTARGEAFAAAFASGDDSTLARFARAHLVTEVATPERTAAFVKSMKDALAEQGPVERHAVRVGPGGRSLFVYLKTPRGGWLNWQFLVHAEDGDRLQLFFRAVAMEPMEPPTAAIDSDSARTFLDAFVARLATEHPFAGVCVVQRDGKDVWTRIQGVADADTRSPIARTTKFGMASGSKLFTAVAIHQLAEAGELSLDDAMAKHLPDFPNADFAKRTSIRSLLDHTSGAGDYWDDAYEAAWDTITTARQMLPHVLRHLGDTKAGEYSYSNSGFILLGLVIEAASGKPYDAYVKERILDPAGMKDTSFPLRTTADPRRAKAYDAKYDAGAIVPDAYVPVTLGVRGSPAGGAETTADDMLRFAAALTGKKLLKGGVQALIGDTRPAADGRETPGLGAMVLGSRGVVSVGHGGIARGTFFEFRMYPESGASMVVLSNYNTIGPVELSSAVDGLVRNGFAAKR